MPGPTRAATGQKDILQFDKDIRDVHLIYDYHAHDSNGKPEKWRYEMYFTTFPPAHVSFFSPFTPFTFSPTS